MIPTNILIKNKLFPKGQFCEDTLPTKLGDPPRVTSIFQGKPPQDLLGYIQQHKKHMVASSTLLSQRSSKLIENVLNPLVKTYVQDLKD